MARSSLSRWRSCLASRRRSWRRRSLPTTPRKACSPGAASPVEDGDMAASAASKLIAALAVALWAGAAIAAEPKVADPNADWPCIQHKVTKLTSAQMWDGPPVDDDEHWRDNEEIGKL